MKITSTRQLYFQPVMFKTISFHHQSEYFLEFQLKYKQPNIKKSVSAYPSVIQTASDRSFNKKKIFKSQNKNKVQTEKFLVLFNDQTISLHGGCNFVVETDRNVSSIQNSNKIESYLTLSLFRQNLQKQSNQQIKTNCKRKVQKVGQETICINFDVQKDYSEHSSFRHILFTNDEYFSSFLFYIDFVHLGINLKLLESPSLSQFGIELLQNRQKTVKQIKRKVNICYQPQSLRGLLQFKDISKLYKLLIEDRLTQFKRVYQIYKNTVLTRLSYIQNYEIEAPENIISSSFISAKQCIFGYDLNQLQNQDKKDNQYFYNQYETDDIDEIYQYMFNESKMISKNIKNLWNSLVKMKLKTLPEEFQTQALKFKIDRMTEISNSYADVDFLIYSDQIELSQRLKNHVLERQKICKKSRFYNLNQLKHSMLTFHSQKPQNVFSNTSQKQQSQILVVLVHGYQGSQRDMAKIKSFINTFTSIHFLPLQTLNKQGNQDIKTLGKKGAQEVTQFLKKKPYITSINVIGFSLGGILAKSILSNLQQHKQKFNLFLTLATPHLGISQLQNCLVNLGVSWMKKVGKVKNIKQLCCQALNKKTNEITLLSLSEQTVMSWFNHVVLVGSNQDTFVPKYSALMAYQGSNKLIKRIQENNIKKIKSMDRITVWFEYQQNCLQKLTGKKGHISFIEDDTFLEYIILKYRQFF